MRNNLSLTSVQHCLYLNLIGRSQTVRTETNRQNTCTCDVPFSFKQPQQIIILLLFLLLLWQPLYGGVTTTTAFCTNKLTLFPCPWADPQWRCAPSPPCQVHPADWTTTWEREWSLHGEIWEMGPWSSWAPVCLKIWSWSFSRQTSELTCPGAKAVSVHSCDEHQGIVLCYSAHVYEIFKRMNCLLKCEM